MGTLKESYASEHTAKWSIGWIRKKTVLASPSLPHCGGYNQRVKTSRCCCPLVEGRVFLECWAPYKGASPATPQRQMQNRLWGKLWMTPKIRNNSSHEPHFKREVGHFLATSDTVLKQGGVTLYHWKNITEKLNQETSSFMARHKEKEFYRLLDAKMIQRTSFTYYKGCYRF